jgi:hypothetical protein
MPINSGRIEGNGAANPNPPNSRYSSELTRWSTSVDRQLASPADIKKYQNVDQAYGAGAGAIARQIDHYELVAAKAIEQVVAGATVADIAQVFGGASDPLAISLAQAINDVAKADVDQLRQARENVVKIARVYIANQCPGHDALTKKLLDDANYVSEPRPVVDAQSFNINDAGEKYPPSSDKAKQLFTQAARLAGVPASWASSSGLHNILKRESNGVVGVPNYTYGARRNNPALWDSIYSELKRGRITARSSATGLGQLILANVDRYYPSGRQGIAIAVEEAAGMLAYIKDRYGSPERAWQLYGRLHEGY